MTELIVSAQQLDKRYEGTQALSAASLDIHAGEIVALLGKNGAGKSTLIKALAGLVNPDAGTISAGATTSSSWTASNAHDAGLHFVFQELEQFEDLTVAENVMLGSPPALRWGLFISDAEQHREARRRLEAISASIDTRRMMSDLTVIEKRLVMIARALGGNLRLLVLDEPTAALTPREVDSLLDLCRDLRAKGVAILYVTHRLSEVVAIADRAVVLKDGANLCEVPHAELELSNLVNLVAGEELVLTSATDQTAAASTSPVLLEVESLGDGDRFSNVSFQVRAGECIGIGGLAGSGRSELVRSIAGDRKITSGSVTFKGRTRKFSSIVDSLASGIVLLPEERRAQALITGQSVRSNMAISSLRDYRWSRWLPLLSGRRELTAVSPYVERFAMKIASIDQDVAALSGGTQQKVVTARAMLSDSALIIMDEPTAGIDVQAKEEIYQLVDQLKARGKAIIVIASDFTELVRMADRVVALTPDGVQAGQLAGTEISESAISRLCFQPVA